MPKANLRAVESERLHPRDRARQAVKRFRLDRERERLPICNQSTGATNLFVDETLKKTERVMPDYEYKKPFPWISLLAIGIPIIVFIYWITTK